MIATASSAMEAPVISSTPKHTYSDAHARAIVVESQNPNPRIEDADGRRVLWIGPGKLSTIEDLG